MSRSRRSGPGACVGRPARASSHGSAAQVALDVEDSARLHRQSGATYLAVQYFMATRKHFSDHGAMHLAVDASRVGKRQRLLGFLTRPDGLGAWRLGSACGAHKTQRFFPPKRVTQRNCLGSTGGYTNKNIETSPCTKMFLACFGTPPPNALWVPSHRCPLCVALVAKSGIRDRIPVNSQRAPLALTGPRRGEP